MKCAKAECLASFLWAGHKDDPALANIAKQSGWMVFEGKGWLCPRHVSAIKGDKS